MRNVTVTMEEEVSRWARVKAAEREMSLARFIGETLRERMEEERSYERAMEEFLATKPLGGSGGSRLPPREERHERARLR